MEGPSIYCPHVSASSAKDENEFSLVLRGPNHFVAPSLLLSRWNYYVAYLFDMNMLPIWEVRYDRGIG